MTTFKVIRTQALDLDENNQAREVLRTSIEIILDDQSDPETNDFLASKLSAEVYAALQLPHADENWLRLRRAWAELSKEEQTAFATDIEQAATANQTRIIEADHDHGDYPVQV